MAPANEYNERSDIMPHIFIILIQNETQTRTHPIGVRERERERVEYMRRADNATGDNWLSQRIRHKWCSSCWKNKFYILLRFVFIITQLILPLCRHRYVYNLAVYYFSSFLFAAYSVWFSCRTVVVSFFYRHLRWMNGTHQHSAHNRRDKFNTSNWWASFHVFYVAVNSTVR